jgi:nucleoside-diphosphate-sugar epimerase
MKIKTAIVTGGAGFIGSHLCETLIKKDYSVICMDNFETGRKENLDSILKNTKFTLINIDVSKPLSTDILNKVTNVTHIFHLASPASPIDFTRIPEEIALVNSIGTRNMLQIAYKIHAKFLFTSTSEAYGDPLEHPQKETYWGNVNPIGIRSCYDESKRFGEMMTMIYVRNKSVDARIIRIFNTYGPRMRPDDGRVISNFISQALTQKPMTIYGDGKQTRSFCYVDDMVVGLISAIDSEKTKGEVINIGNPTEYSILEIADIIKQLTKSTSDIVFKSLPPDDPTRRKPDITKAKVLLNWVPKIILHDGLLKMIDEYKININSSQK